MALIPKDIEERIKRELKPSDALDDIGATLHRRFGNWVGRNPFREDKHSGSFVVNDAKGIAKDFSTQEKYDALKILQLGHGISYHDALRRGAALLNIYIDDQPTPVVKKCKPRQVDEDETKQMVYWPGDYLSKHVLNAAHNPLLVYLARLPMTEDDRLMLYYMIDKYGVGTSIAEQTYGWTVWPYRDLGGKLRTAKLMKYKADGHRDKEGYNYNWLHSMTRRWRTRKDGTEYEAQRWQWDNKTQRIECCLYGLHLAWEYPDAECRIVESEKTALICSAFSNPEECIWLATGGKSREMLDMLMPLIKLGRKIVLYPDRDAHDEWVSNANTIEYNQLEVSRAVLDNWIPADGEKADIGDLYIRMLTHEADAEYNKARLALGLTEDHPGLRYAINRMGLKLEHTPACAR